MKIATWNINSVRLRIEQVLKFTNDQNIDLLCLQETKTEDQFFPSNDFLKIGMKYQYFRGEKSYNGVAILSKIKFQEKEHINWCNKGDCRHISVQLGEKIELHNFYVPAGGDEPDIITNPKFAHKIDFLNEMKSHFTNDTKTKKILVGDLNIAPLEHDVWSHKQLLKVVSHTPIETATLLDIIDSGEWVDVMRAITPHNEKLYSWWSYRNRNWEISNRGRRLDHVWVSKKIFPQVKSGVIYNGTRSWERPSDHVPIVIDIDI
ncbi:exodeoxyribonuclease III [Alphaproteobacteria bacterium]|nr:exodeoxyribonuclease III [Alphaproteobacteria bacterium]